MQLALFQVDAFTDRALRGNPAAVMPLEAWLPDELLQAIADENHLSETAFLVPSADADFDFELRWFTPVTEIELCGHATLASAHVLFRHQGFSGDAIRFSTMSGAIEVKRSGEDLVLDFPVRPAKPIPTPAALAEALGAEPLEVLGARSYLAVLRDEESVRALQPDMAAVAKLDAMSVIATAPGDDPEVDFISRYFAPRVGIDEDPVTGSAHCTSTPYWAERLGKNELTAHQISARGGRLRCTLQGDRVLLAGAAVTYLEGTVTLPDAD